MKHWGVFVMLILAGAHLSAQRLWLMEGDTTLVTSKSMIEFSAHAGWESNALEREMLDRMLFGGFIESDLIERQAERMGARLRAGAGYNGALRFWFFRDSVLHDTPWAWQGQVQSVSQLAMSAPGDVYRLIFQGNNQPEFTGNTAHFDETWVDYMAYQKFGFGMVHKPTLSGFTISAVNGQSFERLYLTSGGLFTSADGDSLALSATGNRYRSETQGGIGTGYGVGAALDATFNLPLKDNQGFVTLGVRDIGFVTWNEGSMHSQIDTTVSFTGIDIGEWFTTGSASVPDLSDSALTQTTAGPQSRWLPGFVFTRLMHRINERDFFDITMVFRPVNAYLPLFSAGYHHQVSHRTLLGATAQYGGYGGMRFGVSAEKWFGDHWFAEVSTDDLFGLVSNRGRGMAAGVRVAYLIQRNDRKPQ